MYVDMKIGSFSNNYMLAQCLGNLSDNFSILQCAPCSILHCSSPCLAQLEEVWTCLNIASQVLSLTASPESWSHLCLMMVKEAFCWANRGLNKLNIVPLNDQTGVILQLLKKAKCPSIMRSYSVIMPLFCQFRNALSHIISAFKGEILRTAPCFSPCSFWISLQEIINYADCQYWSNRCKTNKVKERKNKAFFKHFN